MKKPSPYTNRQKIKIHHKKIPAGDSNYGPLPTAHQLPQAKGRPPQGKQQ
jgi:hypothetical protein